MYRLPSPAGCAARRPIKARPGGPASASGRPVVQTVNRCGVGDAACRAVPVIGAPVAGRGPVSRSRYDSWSGIVSIRHGALPEFPRRVRGWSAMAGLLARGSSPVPRLPGRSGQWRALALAGMAHGGGSPLTVAGAATESVPDGYASPCSHLIRGSRSRRRNHRSSFSGIRGPVERDASRWPSRGGPRPEEKAPPGWPGGA